MDDEVTCSWCGKISASRVAPEFDAEGRPRPRVCIFFDRRPLGWSVIFDSPLAYLCSQRCSEAMGQKALADLLATGEPLPQKIVDMMTLRQLQLRQNEQGDEIYRRRSASMFVRVTPSPLAPYRRQQQRRRRGSTE